MAQQVEDVQGVAPIGLGLANNHGTNLGSIADEQRMPETLHEGMKPKGVTCTLNPDRHRPGQRGVELFDRAAIVSQLTLAHLPSACVQHGHLLGACMQVASNQCPGVGLLSESAAAHGEHSNNARPFS